MNDQNTYTAMTPAERAALAEAREIQARQRKQAAAKSAAHTTREVPRQERPAQKATPTRSAQPSKGGVRPMRAGGGSAAKPATPVRTAKPAKTEKPVKPDTNEFPTYLRTGKGRGGYKPPKVKKRVVLRQHRFRMDPRLRAILLAILAVAMIFVILLFCGVRYSKTTTSDGTNYRFFGIVKAGEPQSGWISSSAGARGKLSDGVRITYANGDVYEGDLDGILRSGFGTLTLKNGDIYQGTFAEDKMSGTGTLTKKDGSVYTGSFADGQMSGYGKLVYADGSVYEGMFADNRKNGQGVYQSANGGTYSGNYVNDVKSGYGEQTFANGDSYKGNYENDMRNGYGVYTFANGEVYDGEFVDNQLTGEATYTWPNGRTHTGTFENGVIIS